MPSSCSPSQKAVVSSGWFLTTRLPCPRPPPSPIPQIPAPGPGPNREGHLVDNPSQQGSAGRAEAWSQGREVAGPGEKPGSLALIQHSAPCLLKSSPCSLKWHRPLEPRGIHLPRGLGVGPDSSHSKRGPKRSVDTFLPFTYEETEPQRGHRPHAW